MSIRNEDINEEFIATALRTLPRVEPPNDFDFKVRARIAQGKPSTRRGLWLPAWAYGAAPVALAVLIGGYFFSTGSPSAPPESAPTVAAVQPQAFAPAPEGPSTAALADDAIASSEEPIVGPAPRTDVTRKVAPAVKRETQRPSGGSFNAAQRSARTITLSGSNSNKVANTGVNKPAGSSLPAMGIRVAGSTVSAVLPGSAAAAAGVKIGDVIETVSGNVLTIRRDGKTMTITVAVR